MYICIDRYVYIAYRLFAHSKLGLTPLPEQPQRGFAEKFVIETAGSKSRCVSGCCQGRCASNQTRAPLEFTVGKAIFNTPLSSQLLIRGRASSQ